MDERAKKVVKFCAVCGRKPEETPEHQGGHIYTVRCEKCQCTMLIHINGIITR